MLWLNIEEGIYIQSQSVNPRTIQESRVEPDENKLRLDPLGQVMASCECTPVAARMPDYTQLSAVWENM